jgi:PAS domain S-box-containing protein
MEKPFNILFVEKDEGDMCLPINLLKGSGLIFKFLQVSTLPALQQSFEQSLFDLIVFDCNLHNFSLLDVVKFLEHRNADIPIVAYSEFVDQDLAVQCFKNGVLDVIDKSQLFKLPYIVNQVHRSNAHADQCIHLVKNTCWGMLFFRLDESGKLIFVESNSAADKILNINKSIFRGEEIDCVSDYFKELRITLLLKKIARDGGSWQSEQGDYFTNTLGEVFEVSAFQTKTRNIVVVFQNVTKRKKIEEALDFEKDLMQSLLDNIPECIYFKDLNSRFIRVNKEQAKLFGAKSPEDVIGKTDFDFFTEQHARLALEDEQYIIKTGNAVLGKDEKETWIDGRETWVLTTKMPLFDADKVIIGTFGISLDITERKHHEEALENEKKILRTLIDSLPERVYVKNTKSQFVIANQYTAKHIGLKSPDEIVGKTDFDFYPAEHAVKYFEDEQNIIKTGISIIDLEEPCVNSLGEPEWSSATKVPLKDNKGKIIGLVGISRDITEQIKYKQQLIDNERILKEQNEEYYALNEELLESNNRIAAINHELRQAKLKAEESDKLKSTFLANMSHEIRTPLNGILGFSNILTNTEVSEKKKKEYYSIINNCGNQLLIIINDLIDISKIEANQISLDYQPININKMMTEIYSVFKLKAETKNIQLDYQPYSKSVIAECDDVRLRQIISNLINNGIKFTPQGSVSFGYTVEHGNLLFFVKDTGIGIVKEKHQLIFERFRQADASISQDFGGTGLGLSISKAYVELMGGEIWLESEPGVGSQFYFTIPFLQQVEEEDDSEMVPVFDVKSDKKVKILIAEDEEINFLYLSEILDSDKIELAHVFNGLEAVDYVKNNKDVDLVLMDVKMPYLDGYQATKQIKAHSPFLPVVIQTAYAQVSDKNSAFEAGADEYIAKPIRKADLMRMVDNCLINRRLH